MNYKKYLKPPLSYVLFFFGAIAFILMIAGVLAILHVVFSISNYCDKKVPKTVNNVRQFHEWRPSYTKAHKVEIRGSVYYVVQGEYARFMPSSESEYYFDKNGNYMAWNQDPGDFTTLEIIRDKDAQWSEINIDDIGK